MRNKEYWRRRFEAIEKVVVKEGLEYNARLEKEYYKAMKSIESDIATWYQRFANNNEIDIGEAKRLLNTKELKEFRWTVEDYIKHGEENTIDEKWKKELENASAKVHITRLESLEVQLQQEVEKLYGNQLDEVDRLTKSIYQDTYYRSAFEIQKGFNVGWNLQRFNEKQLQHVIETPWTLDKMTFSDRIWKRKDELLKTVRTELSQTIIRGDPPDKAIRTLVKKLEVDKYKAGRLIMTESAYFASKAQKQCFNDLDVEKYEIVATLDSHTSEICQELDGQVRAMKDYEEGVTAPPFHPWCRTTTIPYFEDNQDGERAARRDGGKTYYVPSNMTYKEWKEKYVDGENGENLKEKKEVALNKNVVVDGKNLVGKFKVTDDERYESGSEVKRIMHIQGYDGLPKIVDEKEFWEKVQESKFYAQRTYGGFSKEQVYEYQKELYSGEWYIDCISGGAQYGKGMYTAAVYNLEDSKTLQGLTKEMQQYIGIARGRKKGYSIIEELTVDKTAKIIKFNDIEYEYTKKIAKVFEWDNNEIAIYEDLHKKHLLYKEAEQRYYNHYYSTGTKDVKLADEVAKCYKEKENVRAQFTEKMKKTIKMNSTKDISTLAIEMGYDAINAEGHGESDSYTVILNRTKLIIRKGGIYYDK